MDTVLEIINRGNQRGGRPLSVIDLLLAKTLSLRQIAWLLGRIEQGASWMVGAKPGGAGKTTIMSALLAMVPESGAIRLAKASTGWEESLPGECVVAYEISPARLDTYVWDDDVRRLARLASAGCRVVTNLHADTLDEARRQIVEVCGAATEDFAGFGMFLPIELSVGEDGPKSTQRRVRAIHAAVSGNWGKVDESRALSNREKQIAVFIEKCAEKGQRNVADVREAWLEWRLKDRPIVEKDLSGG